MRRLDLAAMQQANPAAPSSSAYLHPRIPAVDQLLIVIDLARHFNAAGRAVDRPLEIDFRVRRVEEYPALAAKWTWLEVRQNYAASHSLSPTEVGHDVALRQSCRIASARVAMRFSKRQSSMTLSSSSLSMITTRCVRGCFVIHSPSCCGGAGLGIQWVSTIPFS